MDNLSLQHSGSQLSYFCCVNDFFDECIYLDIPLPPPPQKKKKLLQWFPGLCKVQGIGSVSLINNLLLSYNS